MLKMVARAALPAPPRRNAKAVEVDGWGNLRKPGQFLFTARGEASGVHGMIYICPCGCGDAGALTFDTATDDAMRQKWHWDGNRRKPTLTPAIRRNSACRWRGHLRAGVFEEG